MVASWRKRVKDFCIVCGCDPKRCAQWQHHFFGELEDEANNEEAAKLAAVAAAAVAKRRAPPPPCLIPPLTLEERNARRRGVPVVVFAARARTPLIEARVSARRRGGAGAMRIVAAGVLRPLER